MEIVSFYNIVKEIEEEKIRKSSLKEENSEDSLKDSLRASA
ncbi:hypothetical protein MKZ20_03905 [Psychrobacillus sp. FSL K6-2684]